MAPLPARRALAAAAGAGAARARGPRRGRGLLRRAGRRAVRDAGRADPPVALARSARTCSTPAGARPGAEARRRLRDPARADRPIAEALLDQRALAGIGNIWRNETLFEERVDPLAPVAALDDETLNRLVATARRLLVDSARRRAGPRRCGSTDGRAGRARAAARSSGRRHSPGRCRGRRTGVRRASARRPPDDRSSTSPVAARRTARPGSATSRSTSRAAPRPGTRHRRGRGPRPPRPRRRRPARPGRSVVPLPARARAEHVDPARRST